MDILIVMFIIFTGLGKAITRYGGILYGKLCVTIMTYFTHGSRNGWSTTVWQFNNLFGHTNAWKILQVAFVQVEFGLVCFNIFPFWAAIDRPHLKTFADQSLASNAILVRSLLIYSKRGKELMTQLI